MKKIFFLLLAILVLFSLNVSYAAEGDEFSSTSWRIDSDGDLKPTVSGTGQVGTSTNAVESITLAGNITFQTSLIANGRINASVTIASSSTSILGTSVPYSYVTRNIGDSGGLDETDGGTRLANGLAGQVLVININDVGSGTLIITPVTSTGFTTLTFDAAADTATLMYFNDTIGWVLLSSTSVTIA